MYLFIIAATQRLTEISPGGLPTGAANEATIKTILSIVFGIIGALSLLMITFSGLRYITAAGDPQKTAQAKNGVVYALVGLALALAAQAIVSFVVGRLS
ncbi:MAG: rane protein [Candidatus Saccharibacteria bacterium]|nr:rane protein [Candidatus Saccharibacteria bacterium]